MAGSGQSRPLSTDRAILAAYRQQHGDGENPPIVINSLDVNRVLSLAGRNDREGLTRYLVAELHRLASANARLAILAANTPHVVFDEVACASPLTLVSIVEATGTDAVARGFKRIGLFGARFTMQGSFYPSVFARVGIEIVRPSNDEQAYLHDKYTTELLRNIFLPRTRESVLRIVTRMHERDGVEAVILGGTELPLLLPRETESPVPLLDTTRIHARAAVAALWS